MASDNYEQALDRAAKLSGIDLEFWDIWGNRHITPVETKRTILAALGIETGTTGQLDRAVEERQRGEWTRLLPPCAVLNAGRRPREVELRLPDSLAGADAMLEIRREDGITQVKHIAVATLPETGSAVWDGTRYIQKALPLPLDLPLGYHDASFTVGTHRASMRLILAPDRAYTPIDLPRSHRAGGVAIQLYGLRSSRNWGCGDFRDLRDATDWVADDVHASFIALNPLHSIHNRRPFNTSPYLPNCVFYQNALYLDIEEIEDFQKSPRARRLWNCSETQAEIQALRKAEFVEYERVHALKLRFLKVLFLTFLREYRANTPRAAEFRAFVEREGELLDLFATYSALDEFIHRGNPDVWVWPQWPKQYQDPHSPETAAFRKKHWRSVLLYKYIQWQIDIQLARAQAYAREKGLSIGLYHDLALATDRFGSDLWAHPEFFVSGCVVGSPPDDFAPLGQDWGFPPPRSLQHREDGYRLFTESIRKNCRHGGALRLDHVMRFFRLYWIPEGMDAGHGAYVRDRSEDLVRILALESVRNKVVIVGEDLGTVEPVVRETLARYGILSYRLFYFEKNSKSEFRGFDEYPIQALVSSTTHDLPTLAGFWVGEDIEARRRAGVIPDQQIYEAQMADRQREKQKMLDVLFRSGLLPDYVPRSAGFIPELTGELHNAVIGFLASTPSHLMVLNQEDLTKEISQQNLPATTWQYPNWSRKMKFQVEELRSNQTARDFTQMFRNWLERTDRANRR
ncbi:MAG: 4-alpha-glucanotransferase [Acidobacteria bacterium]|nr:4-alpha-glucanotransferase [Acidobacteriota bacterium]